MALPRLLAALALGAALVACSDAPTRITDACTSRSLTALRTPGGLVAAGAPPVTLDPMQGITVSAIAAGNCLTLPGDGGVYLVVPQLATTSAAAGQYDFELAAEAPLTNARTVARLARPASTPAPGSFALRFHDALRREEQRLAGTAAASAARTALAARAGAAADTPPQARLQLGDARVFEVLADENGTQYTSDTATLKFIGDRIMVYQSKRVPSGGLTDAQITALSQTFDKDILPIDLRTFGATSDVDGNAHVVILLTPVVNAITPRADCDPNGFVAGFFNPVDLVTGAAHSNKAEIFYSFVPDPTGIFSCAHSVAQVERTTPAVFIHEVQHMISFNQHVLLRRGADEEIWLNEGMSHLAEELGSRYYEAKYPPPTGRTDPTSPFPDSSIAFITGDALNSYGFLAAPTASSATVYTRGGMLGERGATWLFLRWLGDRVGDGVYTELEQSGQTGVQNVEGRANAPFPELFGDFGLALYTDSLPSVARDAVPAELRFHSRNLREVYAWLYGQLHGTRPDLTPRAFPIVVTDLEASGVASGSMAPGAMDFYRVVMPSDGVARRLRFSAPGGGALDTRLGAQLAVFRCPTAAACPLASTP